MRHKLSLMLLLTVLTISALLPNVYASSIGQAVVAPSGQANITLTYTGPDFDSVYSSYTSSGEVVFRGAIVAAAGLVGWIVEAGSISFNFQQAQTMVISFPVNNFAHRTDSKWQILLGTLKGIYVNWSRTDHGFVFTSQVKPELPLPESVSLQLPPNSVDIQFDSSNYIITYQASSCMIATAAYGNETSPEVAYMRHVRDWMIGSNDVGKILVNSWNTFYYSWSPPIAQFIHTHDVTKPLFRALLLPLVGTIHLTAYTYTTSSTVNSTFASVVAFLFAAVSSTTIYIAIPLLTLRTAYKRRFNLRPNKE